jgi:hypothetical protein
MQRSINGYLRPVPLSLSKELECPISLYGYYDEAFVEMAKEMERKTTGCEMSTSTAVHLWAVAYWGSLIMPKDATFEDYWYYRKLEKTVIL